MDASSIHVLDLSDRHSHVDVSLEPDGQHGAGGMVDFLALRGQEGILRKSFLRNGRYLDQVRYAIVEDAWRASREAVRSTRESSINSHRSARVACSTREKNEQKDNVFPCEAVASCAEARDE